MQVSFRDRVLTIATLAGHALPLGRTSLHRLLWSVLGGPTHYFNRVDRHWFRVEAADRNIAVHTVVHGMWEAPLTALWKHQLRPEMTVVDAGANKGYFSLLAASRVQGGGRVISYEPLPGNARDIEATARANGFAHWSVEEVALSSTAGSAELFSPAGADGSGWGSLETGGAGEARSVTVPLARLDDEVRRLGVDVIDLMKMDIQGHELDALRGAEELLRAGRIRALLVEVHCHILGEDRVRSVWDLMERSGYEGRYLDEPGVEASAWRAMAEERTPFDVGRCLIPVQGMSDPVLPSGNWYKILWERPTAP